MKRSAAITGVTSLGVVIFLLPTLAGDWLSRYAVAPFEQSGRLALLDAQIERLSKKLVDAKLRGIDADPPPKVYLDWVAERETLRLRRQHARTRPERVAARLRWAGLTVMALGVGMYIWRRRSAAAHG